MGQKCPIMFLLIDDLVRFEMSLILPPANSPIRNLFSLEHLASVPEAVKLGKLMPLEWAIINAFGSNFGGDDVASMNVFAELEGNIVLANISRESSEVLWVFGPVSQFM